MIVVSTDSVEGHQVDEVLGLVRGNSVRARNIGMDIVAGLRNLVGGTVTQYQDLLRDTREAATNQMIAEAARVGANAIICVRYTTSSVGSGMSEILAYGTAVKLHGALTESDGD